MSRRRAPVSKFVRAFAASASVSGERLEAIDFGLAEAAGLAGRERADDTGNEAKAAGKGRDRGRAAGRVEETEILRVAFVAEPREQGDVVVGAACAERKAFIGEPVQREIVIRPAPVVRVFHQAWRVVVGDRAVVVRAPDGLLRDELRVQRQDCAADPVDGNASSIQPAPQPGDDVRHLAAAKPALDQPLDNAGRVRRSVRSRKRLLHRDLRRKRLPCRCYPALYDTQAR